MTLRALTRRAPQACAVARCTGTLVNMRKQLCNVGSVFVSEIHCVCVVLQSCWHLIVDSMIDLSEVPG
jgi:hypothetical protein